MNIDGFSEQQPVHAILFFNTLDLPASRKMAGLAGHTSEKCFCPVCSQTFSSLVTQKCFNIGHRCPILNIKDLHINFL